MMSILSLMLKNENSLIMKKKSGFYLLEKKEWGGK